jgi:hypothetical protein
MKESTEITALTPTDHEAQSFVDPFTRHANETTGDRHIGTHFGLAVVDQSQHAGVDGIGEEEGAGAALEQTAGDRDEGCCSDGST